ncbi:MAG: hypothetical protein LC650_05325 [Actinobacteria bacterium]|nr:hypothetical protein [Actinomycetota bacterium]
MINLQRPAQYMPLEMRNDRAGGGGYGAPRGRNRKHNGVDLLVQPGDHILSTMAGFVTKHGYCYADDLSWRYVEVEDD